MHIMLSVHLQKFPTLTSIEIDNDIVKKMDKVREICNCVSSLRKEANIRVRMPLKKITICGNSDLDSEYLELIKQEVNTKEIELFTDNLDKIAKKEVVLNMKECGKIFGSQLKNILIAQKNGEWKIVGDELYIADVKMNNELFTVTYRSNDGKKIMACKSFNLLVMIDEEKTQDLIIEGLARDVVRIIQQTRKDNGFEISDRIHVILNTKDEIFKDVLLYWKDYICEQTLADNIKISEDLKNDANVFNVDEYKFSVNVEKVK